MDSRDEMDGVDAAGRVQRACDACRSRKIRCDRTTPCSNCRSSKLTCTTTAPAQKPQRQRVHISDEYEKKIDRIEDRLAGIEQVLESLAAKLGNLDIHKDHSERSSQTRSSKVGNSRSPYSSSDANMSTPAPFEGETAINRQSEFARELLEQAVGSTPSIVQNAEIKAALTSLQDMVSRQGINTMTTSMSQPFFNRALADVDYSKLERPPWDAVLAVLESASLYPTISLAVVFPFLKMRNMKEMFKEAFDTPAECTIGRRILVYGILYNLFTEFACYPVYNRRNVTGSQDLESKMPPFLNQLKRDGQLVETYRAYAKTSKLQMESAMSQLDIYLPATYENILALLLASTYAIEMAKPSLCWIMISNAAGLCQNLGYHRIQTMKDDSEDERMAKIHIFWFIYMMDKTLSLRLGRASIIQDWDMSLPYPVLDRSLTPASSMHQNAPQGTEMLLYWIKVAQVQGNTYEKLFSPAAFLKTPTERAQIAAELVDAMNQAWAERGEASAMDFVLKHPINLDATPTNRPATPNETGVPSSRKRPGLIYPSVSQQSFGSNPEPRAHEEDGLFGLVGDIFYHADVVMHYSTCALIQRAVSGPDSAMFKQDCLESARAALVAHQRCSEQFNVEGNEDLWSGYIHWSILQAPFTPFIVIFCNAIIHCDPSDLNSLSDFVHSLESCRTVSEGANKLYKMCHLFLQVAKLYVEAKTKESVVQSTSQSQDRRDPYYGMNMTEPSLDTSAMTQFDPYLSALGLVPNAAWPMTGFPHLGAGTEMEGLPHGMGLDGSASAAGQTGNQNTAVQDWFSGSRYLMGLMEDDIQMPDFNF